MKVLLSWLHEFLPVTPLATEVVDALTSVGIEVAESRYLGAGFEKIVVAKIFSAEKHPNADRLSLCQVTDGKEEYEIVCGATNFKVGDLVALAHVGAKLPNGVTIKKSKIRGVISSGMLCSEAELGLSEESEGILILSPELELGSPVADVLGLNDWVLELELTPNRGDCLSIAGVAREVAAALNVRSKVSEPGGGGKDSGRIPASVTEASGAPRYILRHLDSLEVGPSPLWLQNRLKACGVRCINNVVDITNYVMLERGQPMHAFDQEKIQGTIEVRQAREGEALVCLDGEERVLNPSDLVITDERGPVAIAGVIGGAETSVTENTKSILLESAHFDPQSVRSTARRLGLHTDSSHRFERWVDPQGCWSFADRAIELLSKIAQAREVSSVDLRNNFKSSWKIHLRSTTLKRILGQELKDAGEYLSRLGLSIEKTQDDWTVDIPSRRPDLAREIDLVEEVARIHGYDRFDSTLPSTDVPVKVEDSFDKINKIRTFCRAYGLQEIRSYSFATEQDLESFSYNGVGSAVLLLNPLVTEEKFMRQSLIPPLLEAWASNRSRQVKGVKLFEVGRVYGLKEDWTDTPAKEELHFSAIFGGEVQAPQWYWKARSADFYDAKGFVEELAHYLRLRSIRFQAKKWPPFLHPGKACSVFYQGKSIGWMGELHPRLARRFEIEQTVILNLHLDPILDEAFSTPRFHPASSFPFVRRDLAFVVDKTKGADQILLEIQSLKEPLIKAIELFDVYVGKGIPKDHRSLAYTISFGSSERTLKDQEVNAAVDRIVKQLEAKLGARLRS